jgi:hypothetical protein
MIRSIAAALIALALTGCLASLPKHQPITPKITLPKKGAANIQDWQPTGCTQVKEIADEESCEYMDPKICEANINKKLATQAVLAGGTHVYVKEFRTKYGTNFVKFGIVYDCKEYVTQQQGAK